jgi:hypothetical protein
MKPTDLIGVGFILLFLALVTAFFIVGDPSLHKRFIGTAYVLGTVAVINLAVGTTVWLFVPQL